MVEGVVGRGESRGRGVEDGWRMAMALERLPRACWRREEMAARQAFEGVPLSRMSLVEALMCLADEMSTLTGGQR